MAIISRPKTQALIPEQVAGKPSKRGNTRISFKKDTATRNTLRKIGKGR